ncbi:hypothetical protein ABE193_25975 [Bacillus mycoides]
MKLRLCVKEFELIQVLFLSLKYPLIINQNISLSAMLNQNREVVGCMG